MEKKPEQLLTFPILFLLLALLVFMSIDIAMIYKDRHAEKDSIPQPIQKLVASENATDGKFILEDKDVRDLFDLGSVTEEEINNSFNLAICGHPWYRTEPARIEIAESHDRCVELIAYSESGEPMFPRIGLFYELTRDQQKISRFTVARMQPYSRLDKEYDAEWN